MARGHDSRTSSPTVRRHGVYALKRAVKELGGRSIDRRTSLGKALAHWRADLIADLGGADTISMQQETLVDLAVKSKLLLDSIDAWLLVQPSLINKRTRTLLPVVRGRQALADALARYLGQLGLHRRTPAAPSLTEYLAQQGVPDEPVVSSSETTNQRKVPYAHLRGQRKASEPGGEPERAHER